MPSLLRASVALLRAPGNRVRFTLRSRLGRSRGPAALVDEPKDAMFEWLDARARALAWKRERELAARYDLAALRARSTCLHYADNLALLDGLERLVDGAVLPTGGDGILRAVAAGCGAFHYATALQRFVAHSRTAVSRRVVLRGVEVDGHGLYRDGHARCDHARAHAALAGPDVHFEVADFALLHLPPQDVVTMLFPFLSRYALLQWGLPLALFRPGRLLHRAAAALRQGGWLLVVKQTSAEFARLQELLQREPVRLQRAVSFATDVVPYAARTTDRVGSLWVRDGA